MKIFKAIRWQYLFILFAGIAIGIFLHSSWPTEGAEAKLITLSSRGVEHEIMTRSGSVSELLAEQGLVEDGSDVWPEPSSGITNGMRVIYQASVNVEIADGQDERALKSSERTVGEMLQAGGIILSPADRVYPGLGSEIFEGMRVVVVRVREQEITQEEPIAHGTRTRDDADMLLGESKVIQNGAVGSKRVSYRVTYENGVEVQRIVLSSETVRQPQDKIVAVGTKVVVEAYEYGRASWYAFRGCMCAAHPYYPDGSLLRVTRTDTGKSIIVTVNDWGPDQSIHSDRIIDLDSVAFKELAPLGAGTMSVKVEKLMGKQ